jgi:outer membrane receptor for Fe3+-dicitrate
MIDRVVQEQLAGAGGPDEVQSVMLQWIERPDSSAFASAASKRERLQILDAFYRTRKQHVLSKLQQAPGVRIQDLSGSGQAILTGPVVKLRELVRTGGTLDQERTVEVVPNALFHVA